jgi:hypothetical protein
MYDVEQLTVRAVSFGRQFLLLLVAPIDIIMW